MSNPVPAPPGKQRFWRIPRWLLRASVITLVVVFLVFYLRNIDFRQLKSLHVEARLLVFAALGALAFRYWMVVIWLGILRALGSRPLPRFLIMAHIYAKAWITRYVPGTVTWVVGKIYMAAGQGISKSRLASSSVLEGAMQVVATAMISLLILGLSPALSSIPAVARYAVIGICVGSLVLLYPPLFNGFLRLAYRLFKKKDAHEELSINGKAVVVSFLLFGIGVFISGIGNVFMVASVTDKITAGDYFYIVGTFGFAGAVGIATPFLPSGIGARDGVLILLLSAVLPKELALVVTIFSRLWQLLMDGTFLLTTLLATAARNRIAKRGGHG